MILTLWGKCDEYPEGLHGVLGELREGALEAAWENQVVVEEGWGRGLQAAWTLYSTE